MIKFRLLAKLFLLGMVAFNLPAVAQSKIYKLKYLTETGQKPKLLSKSERLGNLESKTIEQTYPQWIAEEKALGSAMIVELETSDLNLIEKTIDALDVSEWQASDVLEATASDEVRTLVDSGPSENRIDLVFMGDGYTIEEKELFFQDMERLIEELFAVDTFASYRPLFNIHAVYRASLMSGIGRDRAGETAYGLYRVGDTLRAIYPGKARAIRDSCSQAPGCDYPIVIANDPYYGGLGGEFAISTSSATSGSMVLRHELGHNFGRVGEEYDGGGYFGANNSSSLSNISWQAWLTEDKAPQQASKQALALSWPWQNLSQKSYKLNFVSKGEAERALIRFSASGFELEGEAEFLLDGEVLEFPSPNMSDRSIQDIEISPGFSAGEHSLEVRELNSDGNNYLSSITIHEYAADFQDEYGYVGAFPVFARPGRVAGYRPTNEMCLMRDMRSTHFCPVCQENNWDQFFSRVKLIDSLELLEETEDSRRFQLKTADLGQFRELNATADEILEIDWFVDGTPFEGGQNLREISVGKESKEIEVQVRFLSPEIRSIAADKIRDQIRISI